MEKNILFILLLISHYVTAQVGIGNTNPQKDLHVTGGVRIETLNNESSLSSSRFFYIDNNDDVGDFRFYSDHMITGDDNILRFKNSFKNFQSNVSLNNYANTISNSGLGNKTVTLPDASTQAGRIVSIIAWANGALNLVTTSGQVLENYLTGEFTRIPGRESAVLQANTDGNWYVLFKSF